MLINKMGDLLKAKENLICHQVNTWGKMGGGLALQVAKNYPNVEEEYSNLARTFGKNMLGNYQHCKVGNRKYIINCFTQDGFDTNYEALKQVFTSLLDSCKRNGFTIAIPYGYGSNIANGSWTKISQIFDELSNEYDVPIVVYRLPQQKDLK